MHDEEVITKQKEDKNAFSLQPRIAKLKHKFPPSTISPSKFAVKGEINMGKEMPLIKTTATPLVTTAPMVLYSVNSTPLPNETVMYYDALRHHFTTSKTTMTQRGLVNVQPVLQANTNTFQETPLQPIESHLSPSEAAIAKSKNLRKFRYGLLAPEKANILAKDLVTVPKGRLIKPPTGKGNDLKYFDSFFPTKTSSRGLVSESPLIATNKLDNDPILSSNESEGKQLTDSSSLIDLNVVADNKLTIRCDSDSEFKYRQKKDSRPVTPLYTPASFRVPIKVLRIDYGKVGETTEKINNAQDDDDDDDYSDVSAIRRTLGALEVDGGVDIDINNYDDHTKEEFYQRSKMIASNPSVQVLYLPTTAPANSVVLQEGKLGIIELPNIGDIDKSQDIAEEDASSPMQLQGQRKNKSKNKLTISLGAGPTEEAAAASDQQRPAKEANGKGGMRRTGRSRSSRTLTLAGGAVSSPSTGKVFQCSQCVCKQATLWCSQCSAAYCGICWLRSPAHSKTDIVPVQSCGPKPPYFTVDAFNEETHIRERIAASTDSSNRIIHKDFKTHIPSSRSQQFLNHHHDFERTAARKPEELMVVNEYRDYPLPPVFLDSSGNIHHFQSRTDIRPFSTPDFRSLKSSKSRTMKPEQFFKSLNKKGSSDEEDEEEKKIRLKGLEKSFSPYSSHSILPVPVSSENPHLIVYNNVGPKFQENSSVEGDDSMSEEKREEVSAHRWLLRKKPLQVKSSWKQLGGITNPVPAAYAIAGGSGGAIHVAYSAKPSLFAEPISLSTIDMTGWADRTRTTGLVMDDSIVSGTNESGDNANSAVSKDKQYEIINGRALYMAPAGRTEDQIREENTLREIRKQGEVVMRMHPRAFRLP